MCIRIYGSDTYLHVRFAPHCLSLFSSFQCFPFLNVLQFSVKYFTNSCNKRILNFFINRIHRPTVLVLIYRFGRCCPELPLMLITASVLSFCMFLTCYYDGKWVAFVLSFLTYPEGPSISGICHYTVQTSQFELVNITRARAHVYACVLHNANSCVYLLDTTSETLHYAADTVHSAIGLINLTQCSIK